MQQSQHVQGTLFDFGTIAQTQILKVQDQLCLPYNPFTFDIVLKIIKSVQPYENNIQFSINAGCKSVFGRKKAQVQYVLKAPTVSSRHFAIDENKKIVDLGSTKGTFVWIQRDKPIQIQFGKKFLIGSVEIQIQNIVFNVRKISIRIDTKILQFSKKQNPILLGSHNRCHIKIPGKQYYAAIDLTTMKIYNFLEDQDFDQEKGVWQRLSSKKQQSEGRMLCSQDVIMVFPYIFKVQY